MKKRLAVIGIFAALAMTTAAYAGITVTPTGSSFGDVSWIDGSNLIKAEGSGGYYMMDSSGSALTEPVFYSFDYAHGYVIARARSEEVNNTGLLTLSGEQIIPCAYGDIKVENANWALGFKLVLSDANQYDYESWFSSEDKYFLIETVEVYHLSEDGAVLCASLPRGNFLDAEAEGDYIKIQDRTDEKVTLYDGNFLVLGEDIGTLYEEVEEAQEYVIFSENGQQGIADRDGNVVAAPAYKYVYEVTEDGCARVSTGDNCGLIDLTGKVLVPAEYENLRRNYYGANDYDGYIAAGYVGVIRDGKAAFCDLNGNETMPAKYAKDNVDYYGASAILTDMEGNTRILAADGVETVLDEAHKEVRVVYYSNGLLYTFTDEDYNYGLIDWHGNEILPAQYASIRMSGDGSMLLVGIDYTTEELYTVDYDMADAGAEAQPVAETDAAGTEGEPAGEEPAQDAGASTASPLGALFDSIISLVKTDLDSNRGAVATLVDTAASMLSEDQADIKTILESVSSLVSSGLGDSASIAALLESAKALIG